MGNVDPGSAQQMHIQQQIAPLTLLECLTMLWHLPETLTVCN